jgi:hypothetical protein
VNRFLFTGDTIYLRDGEWVAAVLDLSQRGHYIESLELIRELRFDVLVPWIASAGQPVYAVTSAADARRRMDAILERVRGGADHGRAPSPARGASHVLPIGTRDPRADGRSGAPGAVHDQRSAERADSIAEPS